MVNISLVKWIFRVVFDSELYGEGSYSIIHTHTYMHTIAGIFRHL